MKKSTQTRITRYTLELFVIIFGISVSFLLNEWRENRQNFKAEGAALHAIYDDLIADSLVISNEAKLLANNQTYYNYFLKKYIVKTQIRIVLSGLSVHLQCIQRLKQKMLLMNS